jgi:HPt (histidine-containing phosphotransfer) domain-containing protein
LKRVRNLAFETPLPGLEVYYDEFLVSRKEEFIALMSAFDGNDFVTIGKLAHKWRGFAAPYGFGELAVIATELELCAEKAMLAECGSLIEEARDYLGSK